MSSEETNRDEQSVISPDLYSQARQKAKELLNATEAFTQLGKGGLFREEATRSTYLFHMTTLIDRYVDVSKMLEEAYPQDEMFGKLAIDDYLSLQAACHDYTAATADLHKIFDRIKEQPKQGGFKFVSDESLDFLKTMDLKEAEGKPFPVDDYFQSFALVEEVCSNAINNTAKLVEKIFSKFDNRFHFLDEDELEAFVTDEFKIYARQELEDNPRKLRASAFSFKTNRLEKLNRKHWADLLELDEQLVSKVLDEVPIGADEYKRLYNDDEWKELVEKRDVLRAIRDTSDPEELYDWSMLFKSNHLFLQVIDETNITFLFARIHRENMIKCELYDGLKVNYDILLGRAHPTQALVATNGSTNHDSLPAPLPISSSALPQNYTPVPDAGDDEEDEADTDQEPLEYINPLIDEEELADAIKMYTDGEYRDPKFNKNSLWVAIHVVLCQKHPRLGNKPILQSKSRAKFEQWVADKINPTTYPCYKHSLDTAPAYFRKLKNYPWSLAAYRKAGGQKKSTFESYKHVADYFQESVFDFLDPFLK